MESDRVQNFNDRLNQWIAGQGFWFQLKYSMSGKKGLTGAGGYHVLRLTFRSLVFLVVLGIVAWVYLIRLPNTEGFAEKMESSMKETLRGKEVILDSFSRDQGRMSIVRMAVIGKESAFFTDFAAKNITCRMGLLDSVAAPWRMDGMSMSELAINVRAGAGDAATAEMLGATLFTSFPGFALDSIDCEDTTVTWGFTALSKGRIEGSHMKVRRRDDGWWIQFKGGTFSQNWLKGLEIDELAVICTPDGVTVDKGLLRKGSGTVDITGLTIRGAERPDVNGIAKLRNMPLDGMLPESAEYLVEGVVSGALRLSGSTNSQEGIATTGRIELGEGDWVVLRERIPLLRALRMVDSFNNYRRVRFQSGSFGLKSGGGRLDLEEIDLVSGDLMTLKGGLVVRPPTKEEKEKSMEHPTPGSPLSVEDGGNKAGGEDGFSLRRAAALSRKKPAAGGGEENQWRRYEATVEERAFQSEMAAKLAESLRYEGELEITVRPDAFDQAPLLKAAHPVDEGSGRIPLHVPVSGTLDLVTFAQAEEIYAKGKR
ncbi:hypothetical protein OVA24_18385 [Luteolibacter sp. SL250]|uniref:hypothetical protein n=1 Tax=Luteolibacter sp. SL250 TaxID=2995170 RepID=UPI00226ED885|nr:hypothetical protein [Luteolibacter sp. SL250]WAC19199.1 hypothetical protein OVA24_18385 [Luteolibacter sp. SL250]